MKTYTLAVTFGKNSIKEFDNTKPPTYINFDQNLYNFDQMKEQLNKINCSQPLSNYDDMKNELNKIKFK